MSDSFNRGETIAAFVSDADLLPGQWSSFDGMCGTCRGTGKLMHDNKPAGIADTFGPTESIMGDSGIIRTVGIYGWGSCLQCRGKGFLQVERGDSNALCSCGKFYGEHPMDQVNVSGLDGKPFLHIACDGVRIKT